MNTAEARGRIVRRWPQNWPLRPVMRRAAARLGRDDLAYAERRYQLRSM